MGTEELIDKLELDDPETAWPAASTAGRILESHGLVRKRRKRRGVGNIRHAIHTLGANESGEMMTVDHKGWFRLGDGRYCYPLTINDPASRFVYAIAGSGSTAHDFAKVTMEQVFRKHGVPNFIGSDQWRTVLLHSCTWRAIASVGVVDPAGHHTHTHPSRVPGRTAFTSECTKHSRHTRPDCRLPT